MATFALAFSVVGGRPNCLYLPKLLASCFLSISSEHLSTKVQCSGIYLLSQHLGGKHKKTETNRSTSKQFKACLSYMVRPYLEKQTGRELSNMSHVLNFSLPPYCKTTTKTKLDPTSNYKVPFKFTNMLWKYENERKMSPWVNSRHKAKLSTVQTIHYHWVYMKKSHILPTFYHWNWMLSHSILITKKNLKSAVYIHSNFILFCKGSNVFLNH